MAARWASRLPPPLGGGRSARLHIVLYPSSCLKVRRLRNSRHSAIGNPQWGQDLAGWFIVAIDDAGRLVQVRPGSPLSASVIAYPGVPINPTRQFPFAARLPNRAAAYVLYEQNDALTGVPEIYYVDLANPTREFLLGPPPRDTMPTTLQSLALTILGATARR